MVAGWGLQQWRCQEGRGKDERDIWGHPEETKLCPQNGPVAGAAVGFLLVVFSPFLEFLSCLFHIRVLAVMLLVLPSVWMWPHGALPWVGAILSDRPHASTPNQSPPAVARKGLSA